MSIDFLQESADTFHISFIIFKVDMMASARNVSDCTVMVQFPNTVSNGWRDDAALLWVSRDDQCGADEFGDVFWPIGSGDVQDQENIWIQLLFGWTPGIDDPLRPGGMLGASLGDKFIESQRRDVLDPRSHGMFVGLAV